MDNKSRFKILRGYYIKNGQFCSPNQRLVGGLRDILQKLEFNNINDFSLWYHSLTEDKIANIKNEIDWQCSGDCCNSLLARLLELSKKK